MFSQLALRSRLTQPSANYFSDADPTCLLMANHFHLLVETPKGNLSIGMRQIKLEYLPRASIADADG